MPHIVVKCRAVQCTPCHLFWTVMRLKTLRKGQCDLENSCACWDLVSSKEEPHNTFLVCKIYANLPNLPQLHRRMPVNTITWCELSTRWRSQWLQSTYSGMYFYFFRLGRSLSLTFWLVFHFCHVQSEALKLIYKTRNEFNVWVPARKSGVLIIRLSTFTSCFWSACHVIS